MQNCDTGFGFRFAVADHIGIGFGKGRNQLLLAQGLHSGKAVAQDSCLFKLQVFRMCLHSLPNLRSNSFIVAAQ